MTRRWRDDNTFMREREDTLKMETVLENDFFKLSKYTGTKFFDGGSATYTGEYVIDPKRIAENYGIGIVVSAYKGCVEVYCNGGDIDSVSSYIKVLESAVEFAEKVADYLGYRVKNR